MIVGRDAELASLDELLADLKRGRGGSLLIHGEPGIGKTTLLDALVGRSRAEVQVLRGRGIPSEAQLAFSVLLDVLRPVLDIRGLLPEPQASALASALALGPPAPGERLSVCVASLGVLHIAAARLPVLVVIDDMHWVDASSRECLEYAARRADGHLAVVMTARDPGQHASPRGLSTLSLGPLDDRSATDLLRRRSPGLAPSAAAAIARAAAGNPLALVELPGALSDEEQAGVEELTLPVVSDARLQNAFAGRLDALGPLARQALLIAAAHTEGDLAVIAAACRAAHINVALLAEAEELRLVTLDSQRLSFAHPLVRAIVYGRATGGDRRSAHRALAATLHDDRQVWHLAAATIGSDERLAARLEQLGGEAAARRAFAMASTALERAASLTTDPDAMSRCLLAAGQAAAAAGTLDRALALLARVAQAAPTAGTRAQVEHLSGRMLVWRGKGMQGMHVLTREAARAAESDPDLAATMLADAAVGATTVNAYLEAERLASEAVELLTAQTPATVRAPVLAASAYVLALRGKAPQARSVLQRANHLAKGLDGLGSHWPWMHLLLRTRIPQGEFEEALSESLALVSRAREAGSLATLSGALLVAADAAFRLGDWPAAEQRFVETIHVAADTGQPALRGFALSTLARILAATGRTADSREAASEAMVIAQSGAISSGLRFVHAALGFLELTLGDIDAAVGQLETVQRRLATSGLEEPTIVPWVPDLIEAYVRDGRIDDARRLLLEFEVQADRTRSPVARAAAARCRGLVDAAFDDAFESALNLHAQRPMPFEQARTHLAYGQRLRRDKRRAQARDQLRRARDGFAQLGATVWSTQAEDELRAAGGRRRQTTGDGLTAQELRVVDAIQRGMSNREVAAELFLSPRTIDFHLRQIYRKLGVRSRTQLVAATAPRAKSR
jgi:DNA-binding CsgD family transcriptional regulator